MRETRGAQEPNGGTRGRQDGTRLHANERAGGSLSRTLRNLTNH